MNGNRLFLSLSTFVAFAISIGGCVRTGAPDDDINSCQGAECFLQGSPTAVPTEDPDATPVPTSTPIPDPNTKCVEDHTLECNDNYNACIADTTQDPQDCAAGKTACIADISKPYPLGCAGFTFDDGGDDDVPDLPGATKIDGTLRHCTDYEDALTVTQGVLSFVTQRAVGSPIKADFNEHWQIANVLNVNFATAGNSVDLCGGRDQCTNTPSADTKGKATIWLNGTKYTWPKPGAIPYPLTRLVPNIDLTKPVQFKPTEIIKKGNRVDGSFHGGDDVNHKFSRIKYYPNYWGQDHNQTVITYTKYNYRFRWKGNNALGWRRGWAVRFVDCEFDTKFELQYYPKSN